MSILKIILWVSAVLWLLGTIAVIYGIVTAEDNDDLQEWDGK